MVHRIDGPVEKSPMSYRVADAGDDRATEILVAVEYALRQAPLCRRARVES